MSDMYVTGWAKLDGTESAYVPWMTLKHKLQTAVGQSKLVPFDEIDLDRAEVPCRVAHQEETRLWT